MAMLPSSRGATHSPPLATPFAAAVLRDQTSVDAVEMFDRASLRECESNEDMLRLVPDIKGESFAMGGARWERRNGRVGVGMIGGLVAF